MIDSPVFNKKTSLPIFFLLLAFLFEVNCIGQDRRAVIFFNDGDSIPGFGEIKRDEIKFRVSLESEGYLWDYESVRKIEFETFFDVLTFEYLRLNESDAPVLLQLVSKGEVSYYRRADFVAQELYFAGPSDKGGRFRHNYGITKMFNFLMRKGDEYPSCLNCGFINRWKKRTIDFLTDCPLLFDKIRSNELREHDLKEIVEYYNYYCAEF